MNATINSWPWVLVIKLDAKLFSAELEQFQHLYIGFSGGVDSTVLLFLLANDFRLKSKMTAVHINHGLSPNSLDWQNHCQSICREIDVPIIVHQLQLAQGANLEMRARQGRYEFFQQLLNAGDCLLLAHHENDQAETFILHLLRGAGINGLASMPRQRNCGQGQLLRPLLSVNRASLLQYAEKEKLRWINDESNESIKFSRNFIRHQLFNTLRKRWPHFATNIARSAQHCRQSSQLLEDLAFIDCPALAAKTSVLPLSGLEKLPQGRLNNVLRCWLKQNRLLMPETQQLEQIVQIVFAKTDAMPSFQNNECIIRRYQQQLYLEKKGETLLFTEQKWIDFPQSLVINKALKLSVFLTDEGLLIPDESEISVRFRQGGETLNWHGQTKALKKLFQQWQVPPWLRERIPLLYVGDQLAAVIDYAISDDFYQKNAKSVSINTQWCLL